jgi:hypothetical protein
MSTPLKLQRVAISSCGSIPTIKAKKKSPMRQEKDYNLYTSILA